MSEFLLVALAAATINNIVLERLLGLCPVVGTAPRVDEALATGLATTAALALTAALSHLLNQWLLVPFGLVYLRIIALLALAGLSVSLVNVLLQRRGSSSASGRRLPLITMNCAVLGVALLTAGTADNLAAAVALGIGAGFGFTAVVVLIASLRPRLSQAPVPAPLRGPAIALLTVGMMSLAFLGFSGLGN
jgi:electron transport complex protein RnfA